MTVGVLRWTPDRMTSRKLSTSGIGAMALRAAAEVAMVAVGRRNVRLAFPVCANLTCCENFFSSPGFNERENVQVTPQIDCDHSSAMGMDRSARKDPLCVSLDDHHGENLDEHETFVIAEYSEGVSTQDQPREVPNTVLWSCVLHSVTLNS